MKKKFGAILSITVVCAVMFCMLASVSGAYTLGDVDNDGDVDMTDARTALLFALGTDTPDDIESITADVDGNYSVTLADARLILLYALNLSTSFDGEDVFTERIAALSDTSSDEDTQQAVENDEDDDYIETGLYDDTTVADSEDTTATDTEESTDIEESTEETDTEESTESSTYEYTDSDSIEAQIAALPNEIQAFLNFSYEFSGYIYSDDSSTGEEVTMAIYDGSVYVEIDSGGLVMGVLVDGDNIYLVNPTDKKYIELTSTYQNMLGISLDDLDFGDMELDTTTITSLDIEYNVDYNGVNSTCYMITTDSGICCFYTDDDGNLIAYVVYDLDGNFSNKIEFTTFNADVDTSVFTLSGYSKSVSLTIFLTSLM